VVDGVGEPAFERAQRHLLGHPRVDLALVVDVSVAAAVADLGVVTAAM
jgi:hypothetical protein